jgi:Glycosyl hydrolases family 38 C-terminal beta sandwich domain
VTPYAPHKTASLPLGSATSIFPENLNTLYIKVSECIPVCVTAKSGRQHSKRALEDPPSDGQATAATIRLHATVLAANEANLMEDSDDKVPVRKDSVQFNLHPFEIKTFRLRLRSQ